MHVAVTQNTAADFLSRFDRNPKGRVGVKIRDDITIRPIQVNLQSTDVAYDEQFFFLLEETIETEEEILLQKEQARPNTRIRAEQDTDLVFKAIKRKLVCEEYDKPLTN